uniref:M36 family metallopeptidase n=1 Tax=Candidatus Electronema sp. TaxID=2698783 RepID=UPI0040571BF3
MKRTTALLSPLLVACLLGAASAQENEGVDFIESYAEPAKNEPSGLRQRNAAKAAAAVSRLAAFNAEQGASWKASVDQRSGQVRLLHSGRSKSYGSNPETAAKSFLRDSQAVLGLRGDLADMKTLRVDETPDKNHVRFQQTYDGVPVSGALVLVHSNKKGQVTMAQNSYAVNVAPINSRAVAEEEAVSTVMSDLRASLSGSTRLGKAKTEEVIETFKDRQYFTWKVKVSTWEPLGFWVYYLDAENGKTLYKANEIISLRNGVGRVYKNNKDWLRNKLTKVPLRSLFTEREYYLTGCLWGLHADVYDVESDGDGDDPYAPNLKFLYNPYGREKPWFDAVGLYYRMDKSWRWWKANVVNKYGPKKIDYFHTLSIPAGVNAAGMCNAYYAPELQENYPPGFVFGNEESCGYGSEDLALDDDVVMHEFTHALMEWSYFGRQFGDPVNGYGRAMGEGNADWFAYLYTKDPKIGDVAFAYTDEGYLRNLDNDRMYPADVNTPTYGAYYIDENGYKIIVHHLPEEHYTGEIYGGYLYDLSQVLKKQALKYVYKGMYYFSPAGGFKSRWSDFYDAILAQMLAEKDLTGKLTNTVKAWGSMSSRGLLGRIRDTYSSSCYFPTVTPVCVKEEQAEGEPAIVICEPCSPGSDSPAYFSLQFGEKSNVKTQAKFLKTGVCNEYPIQLTQSGLHLQVTATGSGTWPSVKLYNTANTLITSSSGNTADRAALSLSSLAANAYTIEVCGGSTGKYTLQVQTA